MDVRELFSKYPRNDSPLSHNKWQTWYFCLYRWYSCHVATWLRSTGLALSLIHIWNSARKDLIYESGKGYLSLRTPQLKLVFHGGSGGWGYPNKPADLAKLPSMQLFNLKEDPSEKKNIISNKRYKKDVDKMTQMIKKYVEEGRSTPGKRSANDTGNSWKQIEIFMQ